jgi:diaminohydroxyphosphoribosylaminopyrimidine deaminase/5-amino-6-(5-phosphoribosylamino)uracil reductase
VVVGSLDPFEKVSGRGVKMLRDAGVEVVTGVLEDKCRAINPVFITAHTLRRPYVTLKWAQSEDGFIDRARTYDQSPAKLSSTLTSTFTHRLRTLNDAIMVGSETAIADRPQLTARLWHGKNPLRVLADRGHRVENPQYDIVLGEEHGGYSAGYLSYLYEQGVTSVLVEGGSRLLQAFIDSGMWDEARVEVVGICLISGVLAPRLGMVPRTAITIDNSTIYHYFNSNR